MHLWPCGYTVLSKSNQSTSQIFKKNGMWAQDWCTKAHGSFWQHGTHSSATPTAVKPQLLSWLLQSYGAVKSTWEKTNPLCRFAQISQLAFQKQLIILSASVFKCLNKTLKIKSQNYRLLCTIWASVSLDQILMLFEPTHNWIRMNNRIRFFNNMELQKTYTDASDRSLALCVPQVTHYYTEDTRPNPKLEYIHPGCIEAPIPIYTGWEPL